MSERCQRTSNRRSEWPITLRVDFISFETTVRPASRHSHHLPPSSILSIILPFYPSTARPFIFVLLFPILCLLLRLFSFLLFFLPRSIQFARFCLSVLSTLLSALYPVWQQFFLHMLSFSTGSVNGSISLLKSCRSSRLLFVPHLLFRISSFSCV